MEEKTAQANPWLAAIAATLIIYLIAFAYNFAFREVINDATWSESIAATAGVLLGLSFALSGLTYYTDFLDSILSLRKQLGLTGFWMALFYSITLQIRFPEKYLYGLLENLAEPEVILGLASMAILTYMAIISTQYGVRLLGPVWWRRSLRLGYIAYLLLIIRAIIVEGALWSSWWTSLKILPPPRLLLSVYAAMVILLRICLEISLRLHKSNTSE